MGGGLEALDGLLKVGQCLAMGGEIPRGLRGAQPVQRIRDVGDGAAQIRAEAAARSHRAGRDRTPIGRRGGWPGSGVAVTAPGPKTWLSASGRVGA